MGNGTRALFVLESGFDGGTGRSTIGGRLFGRQAYVGLKGDDWGSLTLGRQYNLAADIMAAVDPFGVSFMQAGVLNGAFGSSTFARMDSAVKYVSPDSSGLSIGIAYSGNHTVKRSGDQFEDAEERNASNWLSLGAKYDQGPISLAASYDRFRTDFKGRKDTLKGTTHMWNLFGSYDFDVVKLHLGYGQVRGSMSNAIITESGAGSTGLNSVFNEFTVVTNPNSSAYGMNYAQTNGYRQQAWMAGLTAPVGDYGKVIFSYQGSATKNTGMAFDGAKGKLKIFSLGYIHNLSKRTSLYALASYGEGQLKFDHADRVKFKSTVLGIGMQHRF